jgi:regulation of enolase protein 1 (concanavalin A-like superfamily)
MKAKKEIVVGEEMASPTKESFKALIEAYKVQNPVKYELKKVSLELKLNSL